MNLEQAIFISGPNHRTHYEQTKKYLLNTGWLLHKETFRANLTEALFFIRTNTTHDPSIPSPP